jgi:hypothetical protein
LNSWTKNDVDINLGLTIQMLDAHLAIEDEVFRMRPVHHHRHHAPMMIVRE